MATTVEKALMAMGSRKAITGSLTACEMVSGVLFAEEREALLIRGDSIELMLPPGAGEKEIDQAMFDLVDFVTRVRHLADDGLLIPAGRIAVTETWLCYAGRGDFQNINGLGRWKLGQGLELVIDKAGNATIRRGTETLLRNEQPLGDEIGSIVAEVMSTVWCPTARFREFIARGCVTESMASLRVARQAAIVSAVAMVVTLLAFIVGLFSNN